MRVKTEAKREAILEAASKVFLELGFEGASMAEIAARVGGSKATLYSYFASKEELFVEVTHGAAKCHLEPVFSALAQANEDLRHVLQRFGERTLAFLCTDAVVQARRAVIAESGRSDIGLRFYENGPKKGMEELARFLAQQMAQERLRPADPVVAAQHLMALLDAETVTPRLLGIPSKCSKVQLKHAVARALDVFLTGYAPRDAGAAAP